jgi:GAF domain-containing protein
MASAGTADEIVQVILNSIAETEADGCAVARFDHATELPGGAETLTFVGSWDRSGESRFPIGVSMPVGSSHFPLSMATRFWTVDDITEDTRLPRDTRQFLHQQGHRALASIPLRAGDQLAGFAIVYRATPGPFSAVTVRLYETIIDQAAVVLERTRLLEDAQRRAAREHTVSEITGRMRETLDVESVLKTAVEEIGGAMGLAALDLRLDIEPAVESAMPGGERV